MTRCNRFATFLYTTLILPCWAQAISPIPERQRLTVDELLAEELVTEGPVPNRYFMPVGAASAARHQFSGMLTFPDSETTFGGFPEVSVQFFSHREHLFPSVRDIIRTTNWRWDIIFSPGKVWSESDDNGFSRASFPFTLTHRIWNAAHNGLATFIYDDNGMSPVIFQIVQETAPGSEFDAWGRLPVTLERGEIENRAVITREYELELEQRLPVQPWTKLEARFGPAAAAANDLWPENEYESVSGLVIGGIIYRRPCRTRFGPYPYCEEMRHGVYSVTKSLGALVAMLRLAQKYGNQVFDLRIRDYVEVSAEHDGWDDVTFADALNMMTGIGDAPEDSSVLFEDSYGPYYRFMNTMAQRGKLDVAFSSGNYPWGPGEKLRYRSIDTFILAAAMDGYLKSREGPSANLWDMVRDEVLRPIGVFHAPMMHTREPNGTRGIPILGEGIFPTFHDVAKIAHLLQNRGRHQGKQLLSAAKVDEALYRTSARGKRTPTAHHHLSGFTYHMSLWHFPLVLPDCTVNVTNMFGHGGNLVQLLPFGMFGFRFQDVGLTAHRELAAAVNRLRPFCTSVAP